MSEKVLPLSDYTSPDWSDFLIDALHAAIAEKLEHNPRLLGIAVNNLSIWRRQHPEQQRLVRRWKVIVYTWQFSEIIQFLREPSTEARAMRRMSPFCGILTAEEIAKTCAHATVLRPAS